MSRSRTVIDVVTGEQSVVPYTPEEEAEADAAAEAAANAPGPPPHLNNGGLARFTGASPVSVLETIRMTGVTRVAKGRYRAYHEDPMPSDQYSVMPSVFDANPRVARVTARTTAYAEVRVTDLAGVAQDPTEVTIKTERVVTP